MRKRTIIILLILTLSIYTLNINVQSAEEENDNRPTSIELTPHDPIWITSDSGLEVFLGTGTEIDPYVVEGYNITTTSESGIHIRGTTKYFTIRNCYVDAVQFGIFIYEVSDGTATVINNTCNNNENGNGISLLSSSSSTVANNTCNDNNSDGIKLAYSGHSTVTNNMCSNNRDDGIELYSSDFCFVTYNLLQENEGYGVKLRYGSDNLIHHNTLIDNNLGGSSQAYDIEKNNTWYDPVTKEGNYWSDLGNKCTYKVDGEAHSKDLYPLNRAQSCPNPVTITILSIVLPLLVSVAILAFVVPKYGVPYTRKTIIPYLRYVKIFMKENPRSSILFSIFLILTIVSFIMLGLSGAAIICDDIGCIAYIIGFSILTFVLFSVSIGFLIVLIRRSRKFRSSQKKV